MTDTGLHYSLSIKVIPINSSKQKLTNYTY